MKNIYKYGSFILISFISYYLTLPALNIHSMGFWTFLLYLVILYKAINFIFSLSKGTLVKFDRKKIILPIIIASCFALIILINIAVSPLFNANSYSKRITIDETATFASNVAEVDFKAIPLLDKDSSQKLGDRVMGQLPELVSQFYVSDLYTQINYNNDIVRVTPLEYNGLIKYFTNRSEGVKGYIVVNSVSGESSLVKLTKGMKYMPSALFNENLLRKLRFSYPTKIFDNESFEIDNEGNPYWIIPVIKYTGISVKKEIEGVIILNPLDGSSKYYPVGSVPSWVDHVYNASLVIEQVNDWGQYRNGYFNSIFGQKNVVTTTEGYTYMVMNDDVFLYTGITSTSSDEANVGFILTNMRTKATNYYAVPGAEEYSAMASAEGQVQQMDYEASFPLLINLNGKATYLMSLKDNAGLVKMYAFVDVVDYQKVVVTDATEGIEKASQNYINSIGVNSNDLKELTITVATIKDVIIDGNTYYYLSDENNNKYRVNIKVNENSLPFITKENKLKVSFVVKNSINEISKLDLIK